MTLSEQLAANWDALGFIRWPLAFSFLAVLFLSGLSAYRLFRPGAWGDLRSKVWLDAILFWGAFATVSGALGTVVEGEGHGPEEGWPVLQPGQPLAEPHELVAVAPEPGEEPVQRSRVVAVHTPLVVAEAVEHEHAQAVPGEGREDMGGRGGGEAP